nr:UDP-N-acetylglucosamine 2-epimerase [uncultured Psychroserpens sp.]
MSIKPQKIKKKIIAVTGARSDYDLLYSVYDKLNISELFDFSIIITGPNLSESFGYTAKNIYDDKFRVAGTIFNLVDSNQKIGRINSIGLQIPSLANIIFNENPDIVLVAGDREESITVTLTCAYMDIAVAHFFGGDVAKDGNIDNSIRYAASKLAHIHFPTLPQHKENLIKLGEEEKRIFVVGNPALDRILATKELTKEETVLAITNKKIQEKYCVLIQHPIITQVDKQYEHIRETLDALLEKDMHCFINYPNSDAGFLDIINAYKEYGHKYPSNFTVFQNLDRITYINLLRHSQLLLGNSSSGIVEVASFGLPVINIGERQRDRLHGDNVIFVDNNKEEIKSAIDKCLNDQDFRQKACKKENLYGDGHASDKIVKILSEIVIDNDLLHKNITY